MRPHAWRVGAPWEKRPEYCHLCGALRSDPGAEGDCPKGVEVTRARRIALDFVLAWVREREGYRGPAIDGKPEQEYVDGASGKSTISGAGKVYAGEAVDQVEKLVERFLSGDLPVCGLEVTCPAGCGFVGVCHRWSTENGHKIGEHDDECWPAHVCEVFRDMEREG